jgi:hypothetical protein
MVCFRAGDYVRLSPAGRADIFDLALAGRTAVVEAVEQDLEDQVYVVVTLDDDPGRELGRLRKPGHCFFLRADEVQALDKSDSNQEELPWPPPRES